MSKFSRNRWIQEKCSPYNNYSWVANTKCAGKRQHSSLSQALRLNINRDSRTLARNLKQTGTHRSLTAPYLCPHCGYYHNGGSYHPLNYYRMLVICSQPIIGQLTSSGSTPLTRRARSRWNTRIPASSDPVAHRLLGSSGYTQVHLPTPSLSLYWMEKIILPGEDALFWLLKSRESFIQWYIQDVASAIPVDLNQYVGSRSR